MLSGGAYSAATPGSRASDTHSEAEDYADAPETHSAPYGQGDLYGAAEQHAAPLAGGEAGRGRVCHYAPIPTEQCPKLRTITAFIEHAQMKIGTS